MKKALISLLLIFAAFSSKAQGWGTVGTGLPAEGKLAADSTTLYALVDERVFIWNGNFWLVGPKIPDPAFNADAVLATDSVLYVSGVPGNNGHALWQFDGTSWVSDTVPGFASTFVHVMAGYRNQLYMAGPGDNAARLSGGVTNSIASLGGVATVQYANNFLVINDTLFAGTFAYSGPPGTNLRPFGVRKYNPGLNSWSVASNGRKGINSTENNFHLFGHNDTLYAVGRSLPNEVYRRDGDTLVYIGDLNDNITQAVDFQGKAFIVTWGGDIFSFDGSSFTSITGPSGAKSLATKDNELFLSASQNPYNGINYSHIFSSNGNFGYLQGLAYFDRNGNCQYDLLEPRLKNTLIKVGGQVALTGINGQYQMAKNTGSYAIDSLASLSLVGANLAPSCTASALINVAVNQTTTRNFGFRSSVLEDYQIQISGSSGWRARHGDTHTYWLDISNAGDSTLPVTAELKLPITVNFMGSSIAPSAVNGSTYQFVFSGIAPMQTKRVRLTLEIDPVLNTAGDSLEFTVQLIGLPNDFNRSDNSDTLRQLITAAFDPNDKRASANYITPTTRKIDYHIRFQNTGNDTALKVIVVDTLDTTLPLSKVIMNSASHSYSLSAAGNVLIWEFNNIMLPDSTTDLAGSQGYIRFSADIAPNLGIGDSILNEAQIYFDYQKPIETNLAKTLIVQNIGEIEHTAPLVEVFPNPTQSYLMVSQEAPSSIKTAQLLSLEGRLVQDFSLSQSGKSQLNFSQVPPGIYILQVGTSAFKVQIQR